MLKKISNHNKIHFPTSDTESPENDSQEQVLFSDAFMKIGYLVEKVKKFVETQISFFTSDIFKGFNVKEFVIFIVIIILFNLYYLTNFTLSIDDEVLAYFPYSNWLSIGRWTAAILNRFIFPQPVIPYTPFLFFSVCLALSYTFLVLAHRLSGNSRIYFALVVFSTYPIWHFITVFDGMLPAISVGMVLVCFSSLLFERTRNMKVTNSYFIISIILQIAFIATAIGAYQSFILLYLAISFGIMLIGTIRDSDSLQLAFRTVIQVVVISLLSLLLYYAIAHLAQWITHTNSSTYLDGFIKTKDFLSDPFRALRANFISEIYLYYFGDSSKFGATFLSSGVIIILTFLFIIIRIWHLNITRKVLVIFLWFMVIVSPFLLNAVGIVLPTRSLFPIAYVIWFMVCFLLSEKRKFLLSLNIIFVFFLILQSLNISGLYNARASIAQQYDRLLAADIFNRIGSADENLNRNQPILIDVYGTINFSSIYPIPENGTMGASFFDWDGGNISRIILFMRLIGYPAVDTIPNKKRLELTPYFDEMPAWPAKGCVAKVNGIFLIKLSNSSDQFHKQFLPAP